MWSSGGCESKVWRCGGAGAGPLSCSLYSKRLRGGRVQAGAGVTARVGDRGVREDGGDGCLVMPSQHNSETLFTRRCRISGNLLGQADVDTLIAE